MKRTVGISVMALLVNVAVWVFPVSAEKPVSLIISPQSPEPLLAGQVLPLSVTGKYSGGKSEDVTSKVTWTASDPSLIEVSDSGGISIAESAGGPGMPGVPPGSGDSSGQPPSAPPGGMGTPPSGGPPSGSGNGGAPGGAPPSGGAGPGGPGGGTMPAGQAVTISATLDGVTSPAVSLTVKDAEGPAVYMQCGGTVSKTSENYVAAEECMSAVKVIEQGTYSLSSFQVETSGNTTHMENSSFYGLNAGVLALSGSTINLNDGTIKTAGSGANGAFAVGEGSVIRLSNVKIDCAASGSHGVDATLKGTIICENVDIKTAGNGAAAAISTDRGSGTVTFTGGSAFTSGTRSPGIYSTGDITVSESKIEATGSEAVVVEGFNSVTLNNTALTCSKECGAMLYQSFSGDAAIGTSAFTMNGGSFTAKEGPMFYITNTKAAIELRGDASLTAASGILLKAGADRWGREGSNGGHVSFLAEGEKLEGDVVCDEVSSVEVKLVKGTVLTGAVNADDSAGQVALDLDEKSIWNVMESSYLTVLKNADSHLGNIHSNGHTIYYDSRNSANSWLKGKVYPLAGGGQLVGR